MNRYGKQFRYGIIIVLCISLLTGTGCSAWQGMSKTGQGATIGAGSGAADTEHHGRSFLSAVLLAVLIPALFVQLAFRRAKRG